MKTLITSPLVLFPLFALLASCEKPASEATTMEHEEAEPVTNRVEIPATVRNNLGITFAKVERRTMANILRVPGSFELQPLAQREYHSMLPGIVDFQVNQFDQVEPSTVLYRFRSNAWVELQSKIDLAQAALLQTQSKERATSERLQKLRDAGFKRAELETEVRTLKAEVARQEAELRIAQKTANQLMNLESARPTDGESGNPWIEVYAAEAGVVQSFAISDGTFVSESSHLLTTVDVSKLRFRATSLQSDTLLLDTEQPVHIVPSQSGPVSLNDSIEAKLTIGLTADPRRRTTALFAAPQEVKPWAQAGVSAFLEIPTAQSNGVVLAIPRSAVMKDGLTHVFFKRDPANPNKAIRVEADLGIDDGRWVEVRSELGPQDEVVLNGAYELQLATAQSGTSQKGGHFHADGTFHAE